MIPLHCASEEGHLDIVQYYVEECHCDVNPKNKDERKTPLDCAKNKHHNGIINYLQSKGGKYNYYK